MKSLPSLSVISLWLGTFASAFTIGYTLRPNLTSSEASAASTSSASPARPKANHSPAARVATSEALVQSDEDTEIQLSDLEAKFQEVLLLPTSDPRRADQLRALLVDMARIAPFEAMAQAGRIESLRDRERAEREILETWAQADPSAALAWANQALADETNFVRSAKLEAIYRGYAEFNPQAAFLQASQMSTQTPGDTRLRSRILERIIETQIENGGLLSAKATIEALEESPEKENLMREMIDEWASYDPKSALNYLNQLGDGADSRLKVTLASEWAESDPASAAAWLSSLAPDDPSISRSASSIVREWARYDMNASAEWLNSLPASPELDRAVAGYTYQAAQEDPANAMTWAESISNDWMRTRMMQRVAAEWKSTNPQGLEGYLENSTLNDEQKKALREAEQRGGDGRWRR